MADLYGSREDDAKLAKGGDVEAFLRLARTRYKASADYWAPLRAKMLADKEFLAGEHWNPRQKREREEQDLPCLTVDRLKAPKKQITNGLMSARPGIQISPVDSGADVETAQALQGLVRNIERQSHAEVVYGTAADDAVTMGLGYWRVDTPWAHDDQPDPNDPEGFFRQEIKLKRVRNAFTVYPDPACQEIDRRDARYYFVVEDIPTDEYADRYPNSKACHSDQWASVGDELPEWLNERTIRIAEYWHVEIVTVTMALLRVPTIDPETGEPGPPQPIVMEKKKGQSWPAGVEEVDTREARVRRVKWAKINALEVLEGNPQKTGGRDWVGRWIPIVPCVGEETDIGGKVDLRGIVRDAKDPSRVYDYQASALIETMMLASRSPYIMAEGQDEGYAHMWDEANRKRFARLIYKPTSLAGTLIGPPQRNNYEPAIQAIVVGMQHAEAQIMATTGFHEPSLGQQGPQESGRAIMARQRQGEIGSSNYAINLSHAIRFTGEILVDLIPHIYDAPRIERILGPDDAERTVMFHAGQAPGDVESLKRQGIAGIYDVGVGRYDVVVSMGVSKDTQRQENTEMLTALVQANPALMQTHADLLFENLDTPAGRKMAERSKKLLPQHLQDQKDGAPNPQQLQAENQQLKAQLEQGSQAYQQAVQFIETKQAEAQAKAQTEIQTTQAELETKERLARMENETRVRIAEIQANAKLIELETKLAGEASLARLDAALDAMGKKLDYQLDAHATARTEARDDVKQVRSEQREDMHRAEDREAAEPAD